VLKLKESYQLSRNAYLLYNIGHIYDQAGQKGRALFFLRKFVSMAPANAPFHADMVKRVGELDAEHVEEVVDADFDVAATTTNTPTNTPTAPKQDSGFKHKEIEVAPPGIPIDITASLPTTSNLTIALFYRGAGDETFTKAAMERKGAD